MVAVDEELVPQLQTELEAQLSRCDHAHDETFQYDFAIVRVIVLLKRVTALHSLLNCSDYVLLRSVPSLNASCVHCLSLCRSRLYLHRGLIPHPASAAADPRTVLSALRRPSVSHQHASVR